MIVTQNQNHSRLPQLVSVAAGLMLLFILAHVGVGYAAPPLQGTVPTATFFTPVPPPPATSGSTSTGTGRASAATEVPLPPPPPLFRGECCLPGVVFNSTRDGTPQIYVMRSDGSGATRLTFDAAVDQSPAASLDGTRIAFQSTRDDLDNSTCGQPGKPNCVTHIYSMTVDGSGQTRLTDGNWQDTKPNWTAGMTRILFESNRDDPAPLACGQPGKPNCIVNIYAMNVDGSGATRLTSDPPSGTAANTSANSSPDDTQVAFVSTRDDPAPKTCGQSGKPACISHLYLMKFDGNSITRLTNNPAADGHPAWSPDGTRLVFETNLDGVFQLYLINADGTNQVRLTSDAANDRRPIWIPGCLERIVFASDRYGGQSALYTIAADGTQGVRLTSPTVGVADDFPAWSGLPASLRLPGPCCVPGIAFTSLRDGNPEIYIMRSDGTRQTRLTFNPAGDQRPAPSPDGTRIAFESKRDGRYQLYVMNVDGSGQVRLTQSSGSDTHAAWSNDGKQIAFQSDRSGVTQLYLMNVDGSGVTQLTSNLPSSPNVANESPNWSPDNKRITFTSTRDGNEEIYVMNVDGSGVTRLTNNAASNSHSSFSPDGTQIVFESNRDGNNQLYVMNDDGSNPTRITNDTSNDRYPYWCPTCIDRIVFVSDRDGVSDSVYATNADGSNQTRLTVQPSGDSAPDTLPAWSGLPVRLPVPVLLPSLPLSPTATPSPGGG